jgi:hypothetical protein
MTSEGENEAYRFPPMPEPCAGKSRYFRRGAL